MQDLTVASLAQALDYHNRALFGSLCSTWQYAWERRKSGALYTCVWHSRCLLPPGGVGELHITTGPLLVVIHELYTEADGVL